MPAAAAIDAPAFEEPWFIPEEAASGSCTCLKIGFFLARNLSMEISIWLKRRVRTSSSGTLTGYAVSCVVCLISIDICC